MSKMKANDRDTVYVEVTYDDGSSYNFNVILEGTENEKLGNLMMITRGTLMASNASCAIAYNEEGFDIVSYRK